MKRRHITVAGVQVELISTEEAETRDIYVCIDWTDPPRLPDNQRGVCTLLRAGFAASALRATQADEALSGLRGAVCPAELSLADHVGQTRAESARVN